MTYYTYKEFSDISHISIRTLRWYETVGIIYPIQKEGIKKLHKDTNVVKLVAINKKIDNNQL